MSLETRTSQWPPPPLPPPRPSKGPAPDEPAGPEPRRRPESLPPEPAADEGERVLVVAQRDGDLRALQAMVARPSLAIDTAGSALQALELLRWHDYALLVLDLGAPAVAGFELARTVRRGERTQGLPILFVASPADAVACAAACRVLPTFDVVTRPLEPDVVRAKVAVFVELHRRGELLRRQAEQLREGHRQRHALRVAEQQRGEAHEASRKLLQHEQAARAEAEGDLRRSRLLADASGLLGGSLEVEGILAGIAELAAERLCAWCVVDRPDGDGGLVQVAFAHRERALRHLGAGLARRVRPPSPAPEAARGVAAVLRTGQPEQSAGACDPKLIAAVLGSPHAELVARLGAASYLTVPLRARGNVLGAMTLVSAEWPFGPADLALAVDLGQRAALSIDNARLYADAQRAVRLREEMFSLASHELRTPVSALQLQLQSTLHQLKKATLDDATIGRVTAKLALAQLQVDRLTRLIADLLDVSRIEAGRLELFLEPMDLGGTVVEVAGRLAREAARAGCQVAVDARAVVGRWDRLRIDQVVTNLLHNAMKYGAGKPIRVTVEGCGPLARVVVTDRGIGIRAEDLERIFTRHERVASPRSKGGMGVGLFIVDQIVRAHGGAVRAASKVGDGSTFTVELPREPTPRGPEPGTEPP